MNRILILGCSGAGKSTLARHIGTILDLPVIHMDREIWRPDWTLPSEAERTVVYHRIIQGSRWVIDGNWDSSLHLRLPACDTVVLLDLPRWICVYRIIRRLYKFRPGVYAFRPDMAPGCHEQPDWEFMEWVWNFNRDVRPRTLEKLRAMRPNQSLIRLRTPREVEHWVAGLRR